MSIVLKRWTLPEEEPEVGKHPLALRQPFRLLVCGGSNQGKTEAVFSLLLDYQIIDNLYVFAKFPDTPLYDRIKGEISKKIDKGDMGEAFITDNLNELALPVGATSKTPVETNMPEIDPEKENIFVFDDMLNESTAHRAKIGLLFTAGRHMNASIIAIFQGFKSTVPPNARSSASHLMLFPGMAEKNLKEIYETISMPEFPRFKDFKALYATHIKTPGSFLFIDTVTQNTPFAKYRLGMNRFYNPKTGGFVQPPQKLSDIPRILDRLRRENQTGGTLYLGPSNISPLTRITETLGEIKSGNDNPILLSELKELLDLAVEQEKLSQNQAIGIWREAT